MKPMSRLRSSRPTLMLDGSSILGIGKHIFLKVVLSDVTYAHLSVVDAAVLDNYDWFSFD